MTISKTMQDAINSRNITGIKSSFYTIALSDPGFYTGKFEEVLRYVNALHIDGLIQEHDGEELLDEALWNEEYWSELASKLQDNFSLERVDQLKQVGKKVYLKQAEQNNQTQDFDAQAEKDISQDTNSQAKEQNGGNKSNVESKSCDVSAESSQADKYELLKLFAIVAGVIAFVCLLFKGGKKR